MGFLNKLKKGVSDAGAIAKATVEVNRLKLQISAIKKDIGELHTSIGKLVYEQYIDEIENIRQVNSLCDQIKAKANKIELIQQKIIEINGEKKCECGSTVPVETRFCSQCGHRFNVEVIVGEETKSEAVAVPLTLEDSSIMQERDRAFMTSQAANALSHCKACSQSIELDARFCEHCGASTT